MHIQNGRVALFTGAIPFIIGAAMLVLGGNTLFAFAVLAAAPAVAIRNGRAQRRPALSDLPISNYDLYDVLQVLSLGVALLLFAGAILPDVLG